MNTTVLIFLVGGFSIGLFLWRAAKGPSRGIDNLEEPINALLRRGYHGGFLAIHVGYSRKFVQLRKHITAPRDYRIELGFPNAKWSEEYFRKLREYCVKHNIKHDFVDYGGPLEFLRVDFQRDSHAAYCLVKIILEEIFRVRAGTKFFVRLENASIHDELIDK